MKFKLRLIPAAIAAMMLAACGGSGSGSPDDISTGGVAVDGYLVSSTVTCDNNDDWKAGADETNVPTVTDGKFTFTQGCAKGLILSGGNSSDTLLPFVGIIKAPPYSPVLSPLTTLIADGATPAQVIAALALASDTDLLATDPVAVAGDTPDLLIKTLAVQHLLQKVSEMLASLAYPSLDVVAVEAVNPIYDEVAKAFAKALQTGSPFIVTGTTPATFDISRVNAWIKAAAESASMPDAVKAAITGDGKLGAARLANAASKALATQANAYLAASNRDSVELVTKAQQASPAVANAIKAAVVGGVLGSSSTDSAVSALADEIANRLTDAVAPILTLRDDTAAVTATAPVTFYFDVNEDVGRIFKATDISVTNGTMGDIVKIDAKHYSMVVTPEANAVKTITVTVPAKTFADIAGNMNESEVRATQAFDTRVDPNSYLYVANNSMTLVDGAAPTPFTMANFQSTAGIDVKWPMSTAAKLTFNLAQTGTPFVSGTFNAAVSIAQELPAGTGLVKAYIKNVSVTKTGNSVVITVPDVADAKIYGVSTSGKMAVVDFSNTVNKVTNTLTTLASTLSTVGFGNVVNYAINGVSNDFTGMSALTGKYKVTIVVADLPLRQADGTVFPTATISVPTKIDNSTSVSVTGPSLVGFINLKP